MSRTTRLLALGAASALALGLAACSAPAGGSDDVASGGDDAFTPITIEHALGTTTIDDEARARRHRQLGQPGGAAGPRRRARRHGRRDLRRRRRRRHAALGRGEARRSSAPRPPCSSTRPTASTSRPWPTPTPDVILAAYSGLTQEDYDTLSEIAPVVAYPETAWGTPWREMIELNSEAMGMAAEGEQLVADLETEIADAAAKYPAARRHDRRCSSRTSTRTDLSEVSFYTTHDTRVAVLRGPRPAASRRASATPRPRPTCSRSPRAPSRRTPSTTSTSSSPTATTSSSPTLEADPVLSQMPAVRTRPSSPCRAPARSAPPRTRRRCRSPWSSTNTPTFSREAADKQS